MKSRFNLGKLAVTVALAAIVLLPGAASAQSTARCAGAKEIKNRAKAAVLAIKRDYRFKEIGRALKRCINSCTKYSNKCATQLGNLDASLQGYRSYLESGDLLGGLLEDLFHSDLLTSVMCPWNLRNICRRIVYLRNKKDALKKTCNKNIAFYCTTEQNRLQALYDPWGVKYDEALAAYNAAWDAYAACLSGTANP